MKKQNILLSTTILIMLSTTLMAQNNIKSGQNQEMQTFDSYHDVGYNQG
jgi:hypothetical protein